MEPEIIEGKSLQRKKNNRKKGIIDNQKLNNRLEKLELLVVTCYLAYEKSKYFVTQCDVMTVILLKRSMYRLERDIGSLDVISVLYILVNSVKWFLNIFKIIYISVVIPYFDHRRSDILNYYLWPSAYCMQLC